MVRYSPILVRDYYFDYLAGQIESNDITAQFSPDGTVTS
jgi:hypothetical protein